MSMLSTRDLDNYAIDGENPTNYTIHCQKGKELEFSALNLTTPFISMNLSSFRCFNLILS